jgi:hypothetical protein
MPERPIHATFSVGGAVLVQVEGAHYRQPGLTELLDMLEAVEAALREKTAEVNAEVQASMEVPHG